MGSFNFADSYRAAGLNPSPDVLRLRLEPFEKLRKAIDAAMAIKLVRMYLNLPMPGGTEWFRDAFGATDPSFSLVDNEREAAVLASGLLSAAIDDGEAAAVFGLLTSAFGDLRVPMVRVELLDEARRASDSKSVDSRKRMRADVSKIKLPAKSNIPTEAAALPEEPATWTKLATLVTKASNEAGEAVKNLANQTAMVAKPLAEDVLDLREEVEMLWWHIGGWSRLLDSPFADLDLSVAAVMAGIDLSDLSRTLWGPVAARAILHRTLMAHASAGAGSVTVHSAIEAFPLDSFEALSLNSDLSSVPEMCPVLTAFLKATELGKGGAWHAAFTRSTGLDPNTEFKPLALALQVFRERQLLAAL